MSNKNKQEKPILITNSKLNEVNDSQSKTCIDSIYNSKIYNNNKGKEKINKNILHLIKENNKGNNNIILKQKEKNFYKALKIINKENEDTENIKSILCSANTSSHSENFLSLISEFPSTNMDRSKDYNISKYLHHPITKQVIKLGNQIIKYRNTQVYRVNNGFEINKPLVSEYNMKNIFEQFNNSFIEIENTNNKSNNNSNNSKKENKIDNNLIDNQIKNLKNHIIKNKNKKIKYIHKKNKSSITNYYFNDSNSTHSIFNCNHNKKNNRYVMHYRDNISSLIGNNKINYKDKESNTTVTKDDCMKEFMQIHEVNDINININIFNNNRNLEVINDFDETKENKMFSTYKKSEKESNKKNIIIKNEYNNCIPKNIFSNNKKGKTSTESKDKDNAIDINSNSNSDEIIKSIGLSKEKENLNFNNKIKTFNKLNNYSLNKTLRKKYERTEFKYKDGDIGNNINEINNYLMKNLMNKFDECSEYDTNKDIKKINNSKKSDLNSNSNNTNKNNETFVIKEVDNNGLMLNLDVSVINNSYIKDYNIEDNEIDSNSDINILNEKSKIKHKNIFKSIKTNNSNNIKYSYKTNKGKNIDKITHNLTFNLNDSLNCLQKRNTYPLIIKKKYNYSSPDSKNGTKIHTFNLDSPFIQNNSNISIYTKNSFLTNSNQSYEINPEPQSQSVYDYTFYQKLLKADEIIVKNCKNFAKHSSILNTEIRLEILLWMMKTCEEFAFKRDTYHNACYYFDKYLIITNQNITNKSELELIGLACIVISAKLEEIQLPRLKEYAELSNKFKIKSIIETEKKICLKLSWRLIVMTKNIWLSWYICQWDLFIDTIDNIKENLLNILTEEEILYYKKPNDSSYYNFRKISQLIDIMTLDCNSYNIEPRILIAASFFVMLCINYKLKYNFNKKKFENKTSLSKMLFGLYEKFITQSFDFDFYEDKIQKGIKYCYNYIDFPFIFDLPLLYQIHQSKLDGDSYEDFLSYQTTNDNYYKIIKERIKINIKEKSKNKKSVNGHNNNGNGKNLISINGKNIILHSKNFSGKVNSKINN